jgi:hypothetical protein
LSNADPAAFDLALAGVSGSVSGAGESAAPFSIQPISKPFVYALALADAGPDQVLARVGVEPSGETFNAVSLEPSTGRLDNSLGNAGAILTSSLVPGSDSDEGFTRILDQLSRCAGRDLVVDEEVFRSEYGTGDRNRAVVLLPAVFRPGDGDRPGRYEVDAGQRRGEPLDRRRRHGAGCGRAGADCHGHSWAVRLFRRVAVPGRAPGQVRGIRRPSWPTVTL